MLLVVSCVPKTPFVTRVVSPTETVSAELTLTSTKPPGVEVVTVDPTFLPQKKKVLEGRFEQDCTNVNPAVPDYADLRGSFVLYDRSKKNYYIETWLSNNRIDLSDAELYSIEISPDRKWLAYLQDTAPHQYNFRLIVRSADGKTQKTFDPEIIGDVTGISGWLDGNNVALELLSGQPISTLVVINPFTYNQQKLIPDFPNIYNKGAWEWDSSGLTIYSPDLRYVVYPAAYGNTPPRYILWDIQNKREIAAILTGDLMPQPQWAENRESVVVTVDTSYYPFSAYEFRSANIDGTVIQMSRLGELFPGTKTKIRSWSSSPDSRHIAFWLDFYQEKSILEERLMMLDTETGDIVDYCIQGDEIQVATDQLSYTPAPVWSPDGNSLLIENRYEIDKSRLILIDLVSHIAYQLVQNISPVGWVASYP